MPQKKANQVFPFVVVLRQRNRRRVEFLGIISNVIFLLILFQRIYEYPSARIINILLAVSVSGIFFYNIRKFLAREKISFRPVYVVASLSLLLIPPINWLFLFFVLLSLTEKLALMPEEIGFADDKIVINALVPRIILWEELNNVILKDDLITIDFKNNKLIQRETDDADDESYDASEAEFNLYCVARLKKI